MNSRDTTIVRPTLSQRRFLRLKPRAAAVILFTLLCTAPVPIAGVTARPVGPVQPTAKNIEEGIKNARAHIYSLQREGGRWEKDPTRQGDQHSEYIHMQGDTYGGYTALATYALLASGESPNDKRIKAAVEFLKQVDIVGIYAIAMRCQVWLLIPHESPQMRALIQRDAEALFRGINDGKTNPKNKGMWDYLGQGNYLDHSVSQYGVLGLWACQQTGAIDVGAERWKTIETAWRGDQYPDGGWDYGKQADETLSMTAAGIASLFIVSDYLHTAEGIGCLGNGGDPFIDKGMAWLDKHYNTVGNSGYSMYGIERIAAASGYKYFASHDWYTDLARRLLTSQSDDGSFTCADYPGSQTLDATCFGLLFLSRGRAPVMMNKLDYHQPLLPGVVPDPANWNERPRDLANLASFAGTQAEAFLQWQIVGLSVPPEDLHDAPILYITGNLELKPSFEDTRKLKNFVEEGGMILANADCGRPAFAKSFEALGAAIFGHPFRDLPPDHPIFTHQQFPAARWRNRPHLRGLSNGARELIVLFPEDDLSRRWQDPAARKSHPEAYELGTDIFQYAVDRQVWNKGESYVVQSDIRLTANRSMKLARVIVGPNWDPEPGGWRRLAAILHNEDAVELSVFSTPLGQGALTAAKVAHFTGTTDFTLSDPAKLELKSFVQNGGTLIIDAAGGSTEFAKAAERELKNLFGDVATNGLAAPLSRDNPVYQLSEHRVTQFDYRKWARNRLGESFKDPRVCGIEINNRVAIYYSREDLSVGLVGQPVDGIYGYTPSTANNIMRNILLYTAHPEPTAK
ncbi:MAG TPA: DUF4159 domain-containing protein [Tepidisphaeraceae bacterium]|jgi:hypothetical protein